MIGRADGRSRYSKPSGLPINHHELAALEGLDSRDRRADPVHDRDDGSGAWFAPPGKAGDMGMRWSTPRA
jgi:hypothetical protein